MLLQSLRAVPIDLNKELIEYVGQCGPTRWFTSVTKGNWVVLVK